MAMASLNLSKTATQGFVYYLAATLFTMVWMIGIFWWESTHFGSIDPEPPLLAYDAVMSRYASDVKVGLFIQNFSDFSIKNNKFTFDGVVWFRFPVGSESFKTIDNFVVGDSLVYKSQPIIKIIGNEVLVVYHIQSTLKTELNYKNFPIAKHKIAIMVYNKSLTPREFRLDVDDKSLALAGKDLVPDFTPVTTSVKSGYVLSTLSTHDESMSIGYPAAEFSITFAGVGVRNFISLYFPMFVLFLISLFSFAMNINEVNRLMCVAAAIPILVLFRMVIDASAPTIGYTTHIDFIYNLFVCLSMIMFTFQSYISLRVNHGKALSPALFEALKQYLDKKCVWFFFGMLGCVVLGFGYTLFR